MRMRILVAVDRDEESQMGLRYTCHLLEHFEAHVHAIYGKPDVAQAGTEGAYAPFTTPQDFHAAMEAEAQRALEAARSRAPEGTLEEWIRLALKSLAP
jgi:nucleotide-binding universal stress UspA family protein